MNIITRTATAALAAAFLSPVLAACSGDAGAQVPTPPPAEEATQTHQIPTACADYLEGWERARCGVE